MFKAPLQLGMLGLLAALVAGGLHLALSPGSRGTLAVSPAIPAVTAPLPAVPAMPVAEAREAVVTQLQGAVRGSIPPEQLERLPERLLGRAGQIAAPPAESMLVHEVAAGAVPADVRQRLAERRQELLQRTPDAERDERVLAEPAPTERQGLVRPLDERRHLGLAQ